MRVTNSMMLRSTLRDLNTSLGRLQESQQRATTGKANLRMSDNPTATSAAMSTRQDLRRNEQMGKELDDAKSWLDAADSALTNGLTTLGRAREIAIAAANTGGASQGASREAYAAQIRAMRSELMSLANTKVGDRSVFAGTAAGNAYDATGAYTGDNGMVVRDVAPSLSMTVNVTGTAAFGVGGSGAGNVFDVLDRLATAIQNGDSSAMAAEQVNLVSATDTMSSATAVIGVQGERILEIANRSADDKLRLETQLSNVEDVDIVQALIESKEQETRYQASLQVAAKIIPPSLMDFLR
jgi:flagellar hook-associated protein 3 FlgL